MARSRIATPCVVAEKRLHQLPTISNYAIFLTLNQHAAFLETSHAPRAPHRVRVAPPLQTTAEEVDPVEEFRSRAVKEAASLLATSRTRPRRLMDAGRLDDAWTTPDGSVHGGAACGLTSPHRRRASLNLVVPIDPLTLTASVDGENAYGRRASLGMLSSPLMLSPNDSVHGRSAYLRRASLGVASPSTACSPLGSPDKSVDGASAHSASPLSRRSSLGPTTTATPTSPERDNMLLSRAVSARRRSSFSHADLINALAAGIDCVDRSSSNSSSSPRRGVGSDGVDGRPRCHPDTTPNQEEICSASSTSQPGSSASPKRLTASIKGRLSVRRISSLRADESSKQSSGVTEQ